MAEANDNAEVVSEETGDTDTAKVEKVEKKAETSTDYRPKLSDEEQLAILEGRAKRLKTKLGIKEESDTSSAPDALSQKAFLRSAGISDADEVDLAIQTAKKWGMGIDEVVDDEDFVAKLDKLRTKKANTAATSEVKGGAGESSAKNTPEYWIAKGTPPNASDVPDRKVRAAIVRKMMDNKKSGSKFYNEPTNR